MIIIFFCFSQIITSSPDCSESFFAQWALKCLPEDGKYKCIDNSSPSDQHKVDLLLNQFTNGGEHKNRYFMLAFVILIFYYSKLHNLE